MSYGRKPTTGVNYAYRMNRKLSSSIWKNNKQPATVANSTAEEIVSPTSELPDDLNLVIATIKASLGLSITDLSSCLDTARQTIYAWIRKEHSPHQENIERLACLYHVAEKWQTLSQLPAKEYYTKIADLLMPEFNADQVISILKDALGNPQIQPRQKSNFEQLLEKHGIKINSLPSQDEQFDLITGKSNFFGEFDEPEE